MKTIRKSIFETNSSSSHTIALNTECELYDTIILDENDCITLTGGEFGGEWEKYNDSMTKANYLAIYAFRYSDNPEHLEMLKDVIKLQTGAKEVEIDTESMEDSYIDHQSLEDQCLMDLLDVLSSKENIRNFIFNPKSILYTGNDEQDPPDLFYHDEDYYDTVLEFPELLKFKDEFHLVRHLKRMEISHLDYRMYDILCEVLIFTDSDKNIVELRSCPEYIQEDDYTDIYEDKFNIYKVNGWIDLSKKIDWINHTVKVENFFKKGDYLELKWRLRDL